MNKIIFWAMAINVATGLLANDVEIFDDAVFNGYEYDPAFEDNFDAIASPNMRAGNFVIPHEDSFWDKRGTLRREKSVSVGTGGSAIAQTYHMSIVPEVRFDLFKAHIHLGVPLHFPLYDNVEHGVLGGRTTGWPGFSKAMLPRDRDFRTAFDAQKIVRRLEIGHVYDPYYLRLSRMESLSLGRGELVKGMAPDFLYDQDYLFAYGHTQFDLADVRAFLAPIPKINIWGASLRFAPFTTLTWPTLFRESNVELTYAADYAAPTKAERKSDNFLLDEEGRMVLRKSGTAQALGLGVMGRYEPIPWFSLSPYVTYGHLLMTGVSESNGYVQGGGVFLGHDMGFHVSFNDSKFELLARTEGRMFSSGFWPGYFGRTYMLDRQIADDHHALTKSEVLAAHYDGRGRFGYLLELKLMADSIFDASIGYENARTFEDLAELPFMNKFYAQAGMSLLKMVHVTLGYEKSDLTGLEHLFNTDQGRALVTANSQIKLLPFVYLDAWAKQSFGVLNPFLDSASNGQTPVLLSSRAETRTLNFGLGVEFNLAL